MGGGYFIPFPLKLLPDLIRHNSPRWNLDRRKMGKGGKHHCNYSKNPARCVALNGPFSIRPYRALRGWSVFGCCKVWIGYYEKHWDIDLANLVLRRNLVGILTFGYSSNRAVDRWGELDERATLSTV